MEALQSPTLTGPDRPRPRLRPLAALSSILLFRSRRKKQPDHQTDNRRQVRTAAPSPTLSPTSTTGAGRGRGRDGRRLASKSASELIYPAARHRQASDAEAESESWRRRQESAGPAGHGSGSSSAFGLTYVSDLVGIFRHTRWTPSSSHLATPDLDRRLSALKPGVGAGAGATGLLTPPDLDEHPREPAADSHDESADDGAEDEHRENKPRAPEHTSTPIDVKKPVETVNFKQTDDIETTTPVDAEHASTDTTDTDPVVPKTLSPTFHTDIASYKDRPPVGLARLIGPLLAALASHNDEFAGPEAGPLTRFHSSDVPSISIPDYFVRIVAHSNIPPALVLTTVWYLDQMGQQHQPHQPPFSFSSLTAHRALIAALTVSVKALSDVFCANSRYAHIGGLRPRELAVLEIDMLNRLNWRVQPEPARIDRFYAALVRAGAGPLDLACSARPMTLSALIRLDED